MTKTHNQRIFSDDHNFLRAVAQDFEFIGRPYALNLRAGMLTVFALPPKKSKPKKDEREPRNKRAESAGRRQ